MAWRVCTGLRYITRASASQNGHADKQCPIPSLPAALSGVQLILHGYGVFEQTVDALEVHAAVSHVLYGTESRKEGGRREMEDWLVFPKASWF